MIWKLSWKDACAGKRRVILVNIILKDIYGRLSLGLMVISDGD